MHWNSNWHMGSMGFWWLLIIVVLALVVWFARSAASRNGSAQESPEQALKRRYANEEIDRDTYERMRDDLRA